MLRVTGYEFSNRTGYPQPATRNSNNMKLRCVHNSIRIRVKKSDLEQLEQAGIITETVSFGGASMFAFALAIDMTAELVHAAFLDNLLLVNIPQMEAQKWIGTNQVGIEFNNELDNGEQLHILIEKDFPCLDREEEDKSDTFFELANEKPDAC